MKYVVKLVGRDGHWGDEDIDEVDLSTRLGERELFQVVVLTPQGYKRVTMTAKVEKYP